MRRLILRLSFCLASIGIVTNSNAEEVVVGSDADLRTALKNTAPGLTIRISPGTYQGGHAVSGVQGTADRPVVISALDPSNPPVIDGGANAFQFSRAAYLTIDGIVIANSRNNGLNIDDGGDETTPSHHIVLKNLTIRSVGSGGNHDGIKLSGVRDFRIDDCRLESWGRSGSGVDMVGCHRGEIRGCRLIGREEDMGNGIQTKGGSSEIRILGCRFEHVGNRAVNIGGSTGAPYFRPKDAAHEARDISVEDCVFIGSPAPIAFVGVDGAVVRNNTIHLPGKYVVRILQENVDPRLTRSRNGVFERNLIVFDSGQVGSTTNVGPNTNPQSFVYRNNCWISADGRKRKPRHEIPEENGRFDLTAVFVNASTNDLRQTEKSETKDFGSRAEAAMRP